MKRLIMLLLIAVAALAAWPAAAQEPPVVFTQAVADLSARTGQSLTTADFANFAWAQDVYPDTGFGCPVPPADVRPGPVSGYLVTITLDGVTYDYRGSADGSIVFLCGQSGPGAPAGSTAAPPTPATGECPTGFAGYLPPRLTVGAAARVTDGEFPNRLRSAPTTSAQQIGLLAPRSAMDVIGGPLCADAFVWWQVRAGDQTGWTAEGAPPDEYFLEPAGGVAALASPAANGPMPQVATVSGDSLDLWTLEPAGLTSLGAISLPPMSDEAYVQQVVFSPDGTKLALRIVDFEQQQLMTRLYVSEATPGATPQRLVDDLFTEMPVSFTADGSLLYAIEDSARGMVTPADPSVGGAGVVAQVFRQAPAPGAAAEPIAEFTFGVGCGGGWSYPAVGALNMETGYGGRPLVLALTNAGLLHSTNCTGSGLALLSPANGASEIAGATLSRAVVSPDGTRVAAIDDAPANFGVGTVTVIDLATFEARAIPTAGVPDRVAWTPDGGLVYSSAADTGDPLPGTTAEPFVMMGFTAGIPARSVSVVSLDPATGAEAVLYSGPGYQVGRLLPLPGGDLLFSVIPAGEAWVAATASNGIPTDLTQAALFETYFTPLIFRLPPGGAAQALGEGFQTTVSGAALAEG